MFAVRDPIRRDEPVKEKGRVVDYESVVVDAGVADKRLLVIEPELARVLRVLDRQGNTLSMVLRDAWDSGSLQVMTKSSPLRATGAHVALVGHITVEELRRELSDVEAANGFANRFIWFAVRRSKKLPEPEPFIGSKTEPLVADLGTALRAAQTIGRMERDAAARDLWHNVYDDLSSEKDGLVGSLVARSEAHVLRLSLIYALLDSSPIVRVPHLAAALELWAYAERSAEFIFGRSIGDPVADGILAGLLSNREMTRTDMNNMFGRHLNSGRLQSALETLLRKNRVRFETRQTNGRPVEVWTVA